MECEQHRFSLLAIPQTRRLHSWIESESRCSCMQWCSWRAGAQQAAATRVRAAAAGSAPERREGAAVQAAGSAPARLRPQQQGTSSNSYSYDCTPIECLLQTTDEHIMLRSSLSSAILYCSSLSYCSFDSLQCIRTCLSRSRLTGRAQRRLCRIPRVPQGQGQQSVQSRTISETDTDARYQVHFNTYFPFYSHLYLYSGKSYRPVTFSHSCFFIHNQIF